MTADSTTGDLERRVARAVYYQANMPTGKAWEDLSEVAQEEELLIAQAALKAHAEWLEEQKAAKKTGAKRKGGYARAAKLSPNERTEVARNAANVRWGNPQQEAYEDEPHD